MAALKAYPPAAGDTVVFQMSSSASSASCACGQAGSQSPGSLPPSVELSGQPISEPWLPGIDTACGWVTGPTPPPPPPAGGGGSPTTPYVEATPRSPSWSRTTARYSSSVPLAIERTSWNTRYGALSSVPSRVHLVPPTGRQATLTWSKSLPGRPTPTSARPDTTPPAPGDLKNGAGATSSSASRAVAR